MAARRKQPSGNESDSPNLNEILSDGNNSIYAGFSSVDSVALIRLIHCISALGGMVTVWVDSTNQRVCFSMRLWGGHKSYQIDEPGQFQQISEPIVGKLTRYLVDKKLPPPPPLPAPEKAQEKK